MKRVTPFFFALITMMTTVKAQQNVERAVATLEASQQNNGGWKSECFPSKVLGECQSRSEHFKFTIPATQRMLVDAVYEAFDDDHRWCTQYRRQDAYSAHNRRVDIEVPSCRLQLAISENTNVLWGGFFNIDGTTTGHRLEADSVFHAGLTLYRYYVLTWQYDGKGNIEGGLWRLTFPANTQSPDVREPGEPKYEPLLQAIKAFKSRPDIRFSRSLSFRRAAADGCWTHLYNTYGFNIPIREEQDVLLPLYDAFEETKGRAYRYLNKPAGETAEDVQIVVSEEGGTIGLGLQTEWNIVYAYFTDEDYPPNRYVYALWYKADVPRRRIVGELYEINTRRPDGGKVYQPFVQRSVPTYLWRMSQSENPYLASVDYSMSYTSLTMLPEIRDMRAVLSNAAPTATDDGLDFTVRMRRRGLPLAELYHELDTMLQNAEAQRQDMMAEIEVLNASHRQALREASNMLKLNLPTGGYDVMSIKERREYFDKTREEYNRLTRQMTEDYRHSTQVLRAKYPKTTVHIFDADSLPTSFTRRVVQSFAHAYRGDGSKDDETLSEYIRQLAEMTSGRGSAAYRKEMIALLDSLRTLAPSVKTRNQFEEAITTLGGHIVTKTKNEYNRDGRVSVERTWSYATMDDTADKKESIARQGPVILATGGNETGRKSQRIVRRATRRFRRLQHKVNRMMK